MTMRQNNFNINAKPKTPEKQRTNHKMPGAPRKNTTSTRYTTKKYTKGNKKGRILF